MDNKEAAVTLVSAMIGRGRLNFSLSSGDEERLNRVYACVSYLMNKLNEQTKVQAHKDSALEFFSGAPYYFQDASHEYIEIKIVNLEGYIKGKNGGHCLDPDWTVPVKAIFTGQIFNIRASDIVSDLNLPRRAVDVSSISTPDVNYLFVIDEDSRTCKRLEKEQEYLLSINEKYNIPAAPVSIWITDFHTENFYVPSSHNISVRDDQGLKFSIPARDILLREPAQPVKHDADFQYGDYVYMVDPFPEPGKKSYIKVRVCSEILDGILTVHDSEGTRYNVYKEDLFKEIPTPKEEIIKTAYERPPSRETAWE